MNEYLDRAGLKVAQVLVHFIEQEALPGTEISANVFWTGFASLLRELCPQNRDFLTKEKNYNAKLTCGTKADLTSHTIMRLTKNF